MITITDEGNCQKRVKISDVIAQILRKVNYWVKAF